MKCGDYWENAEQLMKCIKIDILSHNQLVFIYFREHRRFSCGEHLKFETIIELQYYATQKILKYRKLNWGRM